MQIDNVLASLPVRDLAASRAWSERLFGRAPDSEPMPTLAEWTFAGGGTLQVYTGPDRAGGGSCTLAISDIDAGIKVAIDLGFDPGPVIDGGTAKVVMVNDPDGKSIAFAQAKGAEAGAS